MQYMVVYEVVLALAYNVAFFMDGSTLSLRQVSLSHILQLSVVHSYCPHICTYAHCKIYNIS